MNVIWNYLILKLTRYSGKTFFLVNLCTPEFMHGPGKKPYSWERVVSYDNCPHFGREESRASCLHLFYMPDKKALCCVFTHLSASQKAVSGDCIHLQNNKNISCSFPTASFLQLLRCENAVLKSSTCIRYKYYKSKNPRNKLCKQFKYFSANKTMSKNIGTPANSTQVT